MTKRPSSDDPAAENSPFPLAMAELRHVCTRAEYTLPYIKQPGSVVLVERIKDAIDDWAAHEITLGGGRTARAVSTHDDHRFGLVCRSLSPTEERQISTVP